MSILEAIILGIVQGLTEFLPVSSSGHLELVKIMFGQEAPGQESLLFTITLHAATALSTVVVFRKEIAAIFLGLFKFRWNAETQFAAFIVVSMIPVFFVGVFFKDQIEGLFAGNILLVGSSLLITAILLYSTSRIPEQKGKVTYARAFTIGVAQAMAVLPGISRSGSTISVALLSGMDRERAARFSFLMVLPVIFGAIILDARAFTEIQTERTIGNTALIVSFIAAFLAGVLACRWMIRIVKNSKLDYFAYYCALVGIIAILYGIL